MTKIGRFLRGFFTCRFFSSRSSWPFKVFQDSTPKSHVPVQVEFSLAKQYISMVWFPNSWFYLSRGKCIVAMFSCFTCKTKSAKKFTTRGLFILARCLILNWSRRHAFIYATKTWNLWDFLQFFESFCGKFYKKYSTRNELRMDLVWDSNNFISSVAGKTNAHTPQKRTILLFFFNSKRYRDCSQATILKRLLSNSSCVPQSISCY